MSILTFRNISPTPLYPASGSAGAGLQQSSARLGESPMAYQTENLALPPLVSTQKAERVILDHPFQIPLEETSRVYRLARRWNQEFSLFQHGSDYEIRRGSSHETDSTTLGGEEYTPLEENWFDTKFLAHIHRLGKSPIPSEVDLSIFSSRARHHPGQMFLHTVLGFVEGQEAFVQFSAYCKPGSKTVESRFYTSANISEGMFSGLLNFRWEVEEKNLVSSAGLRAKSLEEDLEKIFRKQRYLPLKDVFRDTGWTPVQQYQLLTSVAKKAAKYETHSPHLLKAIAGLKEAGWLPKETGLSYELLINISRTRGHIGEAYENLPKAIEGLKETGWSYQEQVELLTNMAERAPLSIGHIYANLPKVIEGMKMTGWSYKMQAELLIIIAENAPNIIWAFEDLKIAIEGMKTTGWTSNQQYQLLIHLAKKAGRNVDLVFDDLPKTIWGMRLVEWSDEEIYQFIFKYGKNYFSSSTFASLATRNTHKSQVGQTKNYLFRLLDGLTDYNWDRVLDLLIKNEKLFDKMGESSFPSHLDLYVTCFENLPRLGFNILEGLLEATNNGTVSYDLTGERDRILHFVKQTNGFIPSLYEEYKKEGEGFFSKLRKSVDAILRDEFGLEDAHRLIAEHGEDFLLGVIQMASPTSGASFVKRQEQIGLLKKMMEAGDLRGHILEKWKNRVETDLLTQGNWRLKDGESADAEGKIKALFDHFRLQEGRERIEEQKLIAALVDYLKSDRGSDAREKVKAILYQLAGQNDALREKIDRIQDNDYTALILLEQLFGDKDNLQQTLAKALEKVPADLFAGKGTKRKIEGDGRAVVKILKNVWNPTKKEISEDRKLQGLSSILKSYDPQEIESKILSRDDVDPGLKVAIRLVMSEPVILSQKAIIAEILSEPINLIKAEKEKYDYQDLGMVQVGLRAVKGPAYGLSGLSSGVCTATDTELWQKPEFKLLVITVSDLIDIGMTSEEQLSQLAKEGRLDARQAVGYIHVFETMVNGKRCITLPGINPSAELLGTVNAQELCDLMMKKVIAFAEKGDYHGIYIPTEPNIHSNRSDIQKAIKKAKYRVEKIDKVEWNTLPNPYPFEDVYVVWER